MKSAQLFACAAGEPEPEEGGAYARGLCTRAEAVVAGLEECSANAVLLKTLNQSIAKTTRMLKQKHIKVNHRLACALLK